jgi:methionyl-tRNA formyltransferase
MSLKVAFMGTPDFAVPTLAEIVGQGHEVVACYTRAPAAAGRGMELKPSPVQRMAERFAIPVLTPRAVRTDEAAAAFRAHGADVAVVVAYGMILPKAILEAPPLGCLNLHASLLPRWRGAAPIQRAVMAGDVESGVAVMKMEEGLDTGPVGMVKRVAIGPDMTAGELHDRLAPLGADLMVRALAALERGAVAPVPQSEDGVSYAKKITKDEARIDWSRSAHEIDCLVRGLAPAPGAWTEVNGERLKILYAELVVDLNAASGGGGSGRPGITLDDALTVACGDGALKLMKVQRAGGKAMDAVALLAGFPVAAGSQLL